MSDMERFTLTQQHIDLLRRASVGWNTCESGAPAIDCKRPYGNSYVYGDIAEILGIKPELEEEEEWFSDEQCELMEMIHKQTEKALQIILVTGRMEAGSYVADKYQQNWRLERISDGNE